MALDRLDQDDYQYHVGRPFRIGEFVLNSIERASADRATSILDALDLCDPQTDRDITLSMQTRSRQPKTLDAMNLTFVVDSGCTRCALPKQFFRGVKPSNTTILTSSNGENAAPLFRCHASAMLLAMPLRRGLRCLAR